MLQTTLYGTLVAFKPGATDVSPVSSEATV
jgi:hypothetical protein